MSDAGRHGADGLRLTSEFTSGNCPPKMIVELFEELFVWWWIVSFQRQLVPCDWDSRDRIQRLKNWFYENTTDERRASWQKRALRDLDQAEKNASISPTNGGATRGVTP